jgi:flagellar protein FlaG
MKINGFVDLGFTGARVSKENEPPNREIIQAVRAINASSALGDNAELVFSFDAQTHRPVIRVVSRTTNELLRQIPTEQVLRLADDLKIGGESR